MFIPKRILEKRLHDFLREDVGQGDLTTYLTVPKGTIVEAKVLVKKSGVVAGIEEVLILCESLGLQAQALVSDGTEVKPRTPILQIVGDARTILSAERTFLNILSRMSGIATVTKRLTNKVRAAGYKTRVACTRKVAPGLNYFDKRAVSIGGGDTHRLHLDDLILVKDNHIKIAGSAADAIRKTREAVSFSKKIEIEVTSIEEALEVAKTGADIIMLDNFSPEEIKSIVSLLMEKGIRGNVFLEASGEITGNNVVDYAATGIDIVSLGEITHSVKTLDISLEVVKVGSKLTQNSELEE